MEKPYLVHWSDENDHNTEAIATLDEAQSEIDRWLNLRRGEAEGDDGWALDMTGYIAVIVERVVEEESEAPEWSSFDRHVDYHRERVLDPRDARIAALEGEVAGLKGRLRETCQILVAEVGATGPCDAEDAARRAVREVSQLRAQLDIPAGMDNHIHFRPRWATEFMGGPVSPEVLRHNAYTMGWVDGAIDDYRIDGPNEKGGAYRDDYQSGVDAGKAARGGAWAEAKRRKTGEPLSESAPLRLGRGPTPDEVREHAASTTNGRGAWLLSFGGGGFDTCYLGVDDGPYAERNGVTDAIPLSPSRQPCGVGG